VGTQVTAFVQQLQVRNYQELAAKLREVREKAEAAQHRHEQALKRESVLCAKLAELVGAKKGLEALAHKEQSIAAMRKEHAAEESLSELFLASSRPR
jgi:predicted nuclease with TOPRIM domain